MYKARISISTSFIIKIWKIFDLISMDVKTLTECHITQPFFASFITGMVRVSLAEIINNFELKNLKGVEYE